jgi:hypothetical protein
LLAIEGAEPSTPVIVAEITTLWRRLYRADQALALSLARQLPSFATPTVQEAGR